jgi:ribosomal protein L37AE/L43A
MDARCPECEKVAVLDEDMKSVKCPHCNFETDYENYLEIMKEQAVNMAADYIPDRPGL